ncbi:hypothetical protein CP10139811_0596 [Chlamydia ibidis]|uniref:Uncharacterized protein n=2 Tax=Chlamydia ibidis TaxID=1405396 RepID=S7KJK7_9CHLA|nr:hypothetical protein CP10139811_0596 [Chlamydia ibidis]EQM62498.1 hypothetical protein H359_0977 [Chlamydia ibidis 10-1398/6]
MISVFCFLEPLELFYILNIGVEIGCVSRFSNSQLRALSVSRIVFR